MYVSAFVRRFVSRLPLGKVFTRKDLLEFGSEAAIDQTLARLKKEGKIKRRAWGVYEKPIPFGKSASCEEVAIAKVEAFNRKFASSSRREAFLHGLISTDDKVMTFEIDSPSSQFIVMPTHDRFGCVVRLVSKCARKIKLNTTKVDKLIRALWYMGDSKDAPEMIRKAISRLGASEKKELKLKTRWMPGWMSRLIHPPQFC